MKKKPPALVVVESAFEQGSDVMLDVVRVTTRDAAGRRCRGFRSPLEPGAEPGWGEVCHPFFLDRP